MNIKQKRFRQQRYDILLAQLRNSTLQFLIPCYLFQEPRNPINVLAKQGSLTDRQQVLFENLFVLKSYKLITNKSKQNIFPYLFHYRTNNNYYYWTGEP